ncbi:NYN domain-containing protein [Corynebacterium bovis]|uniref:NYN domain-containing protein n=1 Tax=Corynebacterium bovis TaxID=36808 RepID=UPI00313A1264
MLERTQVYVDTSYLLASFYNSWETGARAQLEIDLPEVVAVLDRMVTSQLHQPVHRQLWYDGIPDSGPHRYQRSLRAEPGVQLRAGHLIEWGDRRTQKAVDTRLVADMVTAALRGHVSDIALVSGDADMLPGVEEAVSAGVRVHLYGFGWDSVSANLRFACDTTTILDPREDFRDCMRLQILEGPLPPNVEPTPPGARHKPLGDAEPPEDPGASPVPDVRVPEPGSHRSGGSTDTAAGPGPAGSGSAGTGSGQGTTDTAPAGAAGEAGAAAASTPPGAGGAAPDRAADSVTAGAGAPTATPTPGSTPGATSGATPGEPSGATTPTPAPTPSPGTTTGATTPTPTPTPGATPGAASGATTPTPAPTPHPTADGTAAGSGGPAGTASTPGTGSTTDPVPSSGPAPGPSPDSTSTPGRGRNSPCDRTRTLQHPVAAKQTPDEHPVHSPEEDRVLDCQGRCPTAGSHSVSLESQAVSVALTPINVHTTDGGHNLAGHQGFSVRIRVLHGAGGRLPRRGGGLCHHPPPAGRRSLSSSCPCGAAVPVAP